MWDNTNLVYLGIVTDNNIRLSKKSCGIFIEFSIVNKIGFNNAIQVMRRLVR